MKAFDVISYLILGGTVMWTIMLAYRKDVDHKSRLIFRILITLAILLCAFGVAWGYTSLNEDELQAAFMGLLVFGGMGLVAGLLAKREIGAKTAEETGQNSERGGADRTAVNPKRVVAIGLLALFILMLPVLLTVRELGSIAFKTDNVSQLMIDNVISDEALPGTIKKALVYQIQYGMDDAVFDTRAIVAVLGSVDEGEWIELFNLLLPEKARIGLVKKTSDAVALWLDNEQPYPQLTIPIGNVVSILETEPEKIVSWMLDSMAFPPCESPQIAQYEKGVFSDDLNTLISCSPPEKFRSAIQARAAVLLKSAIRAENPPRSINLADQIQGAIPPEQMQSQKDQINNLATLTLIGWLLPIVLLIIAIALVVRSMDDLITWLRWPLTVAGFSGMLLALRFVNPEGLLESYLSKPPSDVSPPALAVVRNIVRPLVQQSGSALIQQMVVLFVIGGAILIYSYRNRLRTLVKM